jgi:hypothetical protein
MQKNPWFLGGAKHGSQRCNLLVHIGRPGLQYSAAAYITALTIDFFTVVFGYVIALDVIMQQPMEVSER